MLDQKYELKRDSFPLVMKVLKQRKQQKPLKQNDMITELISKQQNSAITGDVFTDILKVSQRIKPPDAAEAKRFWKGIW